METTRFSPEDNRGQAPPDPQESNANPEDEPVLPDLPKDMSFDLDSLALPQGFANLTEVKSEVLVVPLKKPGKQTWFATHPDSACWMITAVLKDESEDDSYIIAPALWAALEGEWAAKALVPCITRQGSYCVWPIRLPDSAGKIDTWNQSALEVVRKNGGQWMRITSDHDTKTYRALLPVSPFDPPAWPEDLKSMIKVAIKGHVIDSIEHPLVKRLRGEA